MPKFIKQHGSIHTAGGVVPAGTPFDATAEEMEGVPGVEPFAPPAPAPKKAEKPTPEKAEK